MRRAATLAAIVLIGGSVAAFMSQPVPQAVGAIQKVRNNLYVIPGQGGNTAVFVTRTGVILVDTKISGSGPAVMQQVAAVSDVPVAMIINTHAHPDHVGGNEFFAPSVDVVTQENTRAIMATMEGVRDAPQAMPDRTFRDRLTIGRGQDRVDLYYFGPGHTNGDALVVFPAVRAMHAGDLYAWKMAGVVDTASGGSAVSYANTLEQAVKGIPNVDTVIEGHGDVTTWASFADYAQFTRALVDAARAGKRAGRTAAQTATELKLPAKFADYLAGEGAERARDFIAAVYADM